MPAVRSACSRSSVVAQVRVIVEYIEAGAVAPAMRWERMCPSNSGLAEGETFELLGRAFEVAQREEGAGFAESLAAFLKGAMIRKQDVLNAMMDIDDSL